MAVNTWEANTDTDYNTDANWSRGHVPLVSEDVLYNGSVTNSNCVMSGAGTCKGISFSNGYSGTLNANGQSMTIAANGLDCSNGGSATLTLGGTWECSSDWDTGDIGTFNHGSGKVKLTGSANWKDGRASHQYYDVEIAAGASITIPYSEGKPLVTNGIDVYGTLTVAHEDDYLYLSSTGVLRLQSGGEIIGPGTSNLTVFIEAPAAGKGVTVNDGTWTTAELRIRVGSATSSLASGSYNGFRMYQSSGTVSYQWPSGTFTFTGPWRFYANGGTLTLDNSVNDPSFVWQSDVQFDDGGTTNYTQGTGAITISGGNAQSLDLAGKSTEEIEIDKSAGTATLTASVSPDSLTMTAGTLDIDGNDVSCDTTCTQAAGTTIQDTAGGGEISGTTLDINGVDGNECVWNGPDVNFSSSGDADWCTVTNSATDAACVTIDATDNCTDGGGNGAKWNFGGAEEEASLTEVIATVEQPAVTATYVLQVSASLSEAVAAVEQPAVTPTYVLEVSASVPEVVAAVEQPAVSPAWVLEVSASLSEVVATVEQPAVTASLSNEQTASLDVVQATVEQPAVSRTYVLEQTASFSEAAATVQQPAVTAQHVAEYSASLAVAQAAVEQPAVTATEGNQQTATLSEAVAAVEQPAVTATSVSEWNAPLTVAQAAVEQPVVTGSAANEQTATLAAAQAGVEQPAVTATHQAQYQAALAVVQATVAQPSAITVWRSGRFARPHGLKSTDGNWFPAVGSHLWPMLYEKTADDSGYIKGTLQDGNSECQLWLSGLDDPGVNTDHWLRVRFDTGGYDDTAFTLILRQDGTTIKTMGPYSGFMWAGWHTVEVELSEAEAALITDYTALHCRFVMDVSGAPAPREVRVSWQELETPKPVLAVLDTVVATVQQPGVGAIAEVYTGPYRVAAGQLASAGAAAGQLAATGAQAGQLAASGAAAGQIVA